MALSLVLPLVMPEQSVWYTLEGLVTTGLTPYRSHMATSDLSIAVVCIISGWAFSSSTARIVSCTVERERPTSHHPFSDARPIYVLIDSGRYGRKSARNLDLRQICFAAHQFRAHDAIL